MIKYLYGKLIKKIQFSVIKKYNIDKKSKIVSKSHLVDVELGKYSYIGNNCVVLSSFNFILMEVSE